MSLQVSSLHLQVPTPTFGAETLGDGDLLTDYLAPLCKVLSEWHGRLKGSGYRAATVRILAAGHADLSIACQQRRTECRFLPNSNNISCEYIPRLTNVHLLTVVWSPSESDVCRACERLALCGLSASA